MGKNTAQHFGRSCSACQLFVLVDWAVGGDFEHADICRLILKGHHGEIATAKSCNSQKAASRLRHRHDRAITKHRVPGRRHMPPPSLACFLLEGGRGGPGWGRQPRDRKRQEYGKGQSLHRGGLSITALPQAVFHGTKTQNQNLDYPRGSPYILQVRRRPFRSFFLDARRFPGPFRIFAGCFGRNARSHRSATSRTFLLHLGCRFVVRLHRYFVGEPVFQRRQLPAVLEHFPEQAALRLDRAPLLHHQQGQNPVRNQEQDDQQRKQRASRFRLWCCTLRGIDNCQGAPKLPGTLG